MAQFISSSRSRKRREGVILASVVALFTAASLILTSSAQERPAAAQGKSTAAGGAKHGEQIFDTRCVICHNKRPGDTSPFGPPNITDAFKNKSLTVAQAENIIVHGKGQMPAWSTILSKSDIASVIAYIKTAK